MTTMTHETVTHDTGQDDAGALFAAPPVLPDGKQAGSLLDFIAADAGKRLGAGEGKVTATKAGYRVKGTRVLALLAGQDAVREVLTAGTTRVTVDAGQEGPLRLWLQHALSRQDVDGVPVVLRRTKASLFLDVDASGYGQHEAKAPAPKRWAPAAGDVVTLVGGELDGGTAQVWCTLADGSTVAVVDDDTQRPVVIFEDGDWRRYASSAWDRWDAEQERVPDGAGVYVEQGEQEHAARCEPWRLAAGLEPARTWVMWLDGDDVIVNGVRLNHVPNGYSPYYSGGERYAAAGMHGLSAGSVFGRTRIYFHPPADAEVRDAGAYYAAAARRREDWMLLHDVDRAVREDATDTQAYAAMWAELDRRTTPDPA